MMDLDLGQDESGNKTIGISFPTNVINAGTIREPLSLAQSNRSCWNKPGKTQRWWVTPLRIGISFFSLLITFGLMYWLVHWGNKNWET
jgi:hypothetical protein